jgi:hypothetical protein
MVSMRHRLPVAPCRDVEGFVGIAGALDVVVVVVVVVKVSAWLLGPSPVAQV